MADAAAALEARLASLETNGFKLNPATANPGKRMLLRQRSDRIAWTRWPQACSRAARSPARPGRDAWHGEAVPKHGVDKLAD